jgi:hypothetical protein
MFKGFIVVGVAYGVGYLNGYLKGQEHTEELKALIRDLRDSEETKAFIVDLREALRNTGETKTEEDPEPSIDVTDVIETSDKPSV